LQRANLEVAAPPGTGVLESDVYPPVFLPATRNITLVTTAEVDTADGYGGKPLPFFKNYYSGGIGSVRGFRTASLARATSTERFSRQSQAQRDHGGAVPMPGQAQDRSMRLGVFVDAGQVYGATDKVDLGQLRAAWGFSFA